MFILRIIVGLVVGAIVGMVVMMGLHLASTLIYVPPEDVEFMSQEPENLERMNEWFRSLPAGAFIVAALCHGLGCLAGAMTAMFIAGRHSLVAPLIIAAFFTLGGIMNMQELPHPGWFPFLDLPIYFVLVWVTARHLQTPPPASADAPAVRTGSPDSPFAPPNSENSRA